MSLENQQKGLRQQLQQQQSQNIRDIDFMGGSENNLGDFQNFEKFDLPLEDGGADLYDTDSLNSFKLGVGGTHFRGVISNAGCGVQGPHQETLTSAGKFQDYFNSAMTGEDGNASERSFNQFQSGYESRPHKTKSAIYPTKVSQKGQSHNLIGGGLPFQSEYETFYSQEKMPSKHSHIMNNKGSNTLGYPAGKGKINQDEQEQQKQMKLMNALKSNPQDLEQILEEQEKQQIIKKKLKIEAEPKPNISKNASSIQLSNYSPTMESIKRVESNTSLNGTDKQGQKNLSKIKGNVKNAYIKKITSLLNLQNQAATDQHDNFQEPRRPDNSEDSDDSRSKSYENVKQEDGKKVMKNRESARNSRQRKKIYIELLEKKISELTTQIETQCVNIEKSQKDICKILDSHSHIKAFVQTRHDYIQKIGEMANLEKPNNEQLGYILDSLRLRIGAQGTCRQKALSLYFKTIMKFFMQSSFPYLIYGYQQDIGEDQEFNRCVEIFKKICHIQEETQVFKFLPYLKRFLDSRKNFKDSYQKMKKIRKSVFKREESIEKLLDGLSLLHPTQMGRFLKGLDKFRKYKEIRLQRKKTIESNSQLESELDKCKKETPVNNKQASKFRSISVQNPFMNTINSNIIPNNLNNSINQSNILNGYTQIPSSQMQYQSMQQMSVPNLEISGDDSQFESISISINKNQGIPQNYRYQKAPQSIPLQKEGVNYQNYMFTPQNGAVLHSKPPEMDQYFHSLPYKKSFYSDVNPNNNTPF